GVLSPVVSLLSYGACPLPAGRFVRSRSSRCAVFAFSFFPVAPPAPIYALSLHDALPICLALPRARSGPLAKGPGRAIFPPRNRGTTRPGAPRTVLCCDFLRETGLRPFSNSAKNPKVVLAGKNGYSEAATPVR